MNQFFFVGGVVVVIRVGRRGGGQFPCLCCNYFTESTASTIAVASPHPRFSNDANIIQALLGFQ